jgi:hypothetical protein
MRVSIETVMIPISNGLGTPLTPKLPLRNSSSASVVRRAILLMRSNIILVNFIKIVAKYS